MKKSAISLFLLIIALNVYPQSYLFDSIPDNLKRRADAVIRSEQCLYTIIKPGNSNMKIKKAVTLLNEEANGYRYLRVYYDKYSKVNYLRGTIYDEKGMIIKVLGLDDVVDMSAITGGSFYTDDRMKVLYFPIYKFPYTIEYEYEISYSSIINYPSWSFQDSPDVSVEKSGIQYIVPVSMKLRFYEENLQNKVDSVILADRKIYTWQEENIPANPEPQYFVKTIYPTPVLYTAPLEFEYGGFKGSMASWKDFGEWVYSINKGRDNLPAEEINTIREVVSKAGSEREKVKLVYEYVQSKTRYVSISIGIGGYRTAEASSVSKNGFGDCKALANYTMSLLKSLGINSFYTLAKAGTLFDINKDFISNEFNHVILCIPMKEDSIWLDCTSQTLPFNYLSDFTSGRNVLLITPEGGKMVRSPGFTKGQNQFKRTGTVYLNILGASSARMSNYYAGYNFGDASSLFSMQSEEEMKRYLYSGLRFSDFNVTSTGYSENKSENPSCLFSYQISVTDFATTKGPRIYFNPSVSRGEYIRDSPSRFKIVESEIVSDSISYIIPLGYNVEYLPKDVFLQNEFGRFSFHLATVNDQVIFKRSLELNKSVVPLEKFDEFRGFINAVAKADRERIILIKAGSTTEI